MGTKSASNYCLLEKSQLPPPVWEVIVPLVSRADEEMNYKSLWTEQYRHLDTWGHTTFFSILTQESQPHYTLEYVPR